MELEKYKELLIGNILIIGDKKNLIVDVLLDQNLSKYIVVEHYDFEQNRLLKRHLPKENINRIVNHPSS